MTSRRRMCSSSWEEDHAELRVRQLVELRLPAAGSSVAASRRPWARAAADDVHTVTCRRTSIDSCSSLTIVCTSAGTGSRGARVRSRARAARPGQRARAASVRPDSHSAPAMRRIVRPDETRAGTIGGAVKGIQHLSAKGGLDAGAGREQRDDARHDHQQPGWRNRWRAAAASAAILQEAEEQHGGAADRVDHCQSDCTTVQPIRARLIAASDRGCRGASGSARARPAVALLSDSACSDEADRRSAERARDQIANDAALRSRLRRAPRGTAAGGRARRRTSSPLLGHDLHELQDRRVADRAIVGKRPIHVAHGRWARVARRPAGSRARSLSAERRLAGASARCYTKVFVTSASSYRGSEVPKFRGF